MSGTYAQGGNGFKAHRRQYHGRLTSRNGAAVQMSVLMGENVPIAQVRILYLQYEMGIVVLLAGYTFA